ncbi:head GIN domain-containing protein [Flavivirga jejuensis]|uniref:Head GIN domain-containing protein n=1 Tax=Flavivirga jejuensis TaxID=870487 RepID=A0ABT8WIT9_9FLAO|nr:head GIN domain-containing protein [Flavivirga jejuensis]MDO5973066.1 head GIN domain-containing protein [Flavivirga jejuensis]
MKRIVHIFVLFLIIACDSENAGNCFQKTGDIIQQEVVVDSFTKIFVNRDIELIIKEGATHKVIIETGENLLNDVSAIVLDGKLTLTDNNTCNYVRDYGITKVYVTSPNITEIRSSTQYDISSDGILRYPSLTILSEDYGEPDTFTNADFRLEIDNNLFVVVFNNISNCFISGKTESLNLTFASGASRFEGRDLIAQKVQLWNRGSNDMFVNPQQEIKGTISGTGNVISVNQPLIVEVDELYKGRLVFE